MPQSSQYAVNGFYPWPVPVSLSDEAAVFACGPRLYRVDARLRALGRIVSGDVTQVVQTEDGVFALEWTAGPSSRAGRWTWTAFPTPTIWRTGAIRWNTSS